MKPPREIPAYDCHEFAPKRADYCVAVFIINEGAKFHKQLERMRTVASTVDLVIADGGSTDGSTAPETLQGFGVNTLLVRTGPGRLGAQMRMAFAWALDRGYKGVVVVDGNNKDSVEDVPRFCEKLAEGFDHVQGSRFIPGGHHENTPFGRLWGVRLLHAPLLSLAARFRHTDTTNGFRAYSRTLLEDPRVALFRDVFSGYELHYYLALKAPRLGFNCVEIPVTRVYPKSGKTPTKISPIRGNLNVLKKLFAVCCGRYDPPKAAP
ncbi:MAG: glycosyltransferase family 2 protein [Opitutales bacterium]